ncbi:unnamed protein product [Caenorhabditis bovis]|uniref:Nascent polypeptide-associated complex subunit alpha-like UBA domain-containing protein n=1 Tax=Caenorhabditis bovis TaxID=2654633 RepID=A0A8S1F8Q3_9PELO|nr:unnamed protein product [Caenorhabditis bovis]
MTTEDHADEKSVDKHNWGSEELSKKMSDDESDFDEHYIPEVSDVQEEKDDLKMNTDALGKIFNSSAPVRPKINIKKEDLQMIMTELELPEATVRNALLETEGDARKALRLLIGINN